MRFLIIVSIFIFSQSAFSGDKIGFGGKLNILALHLTGEFAIFCNDHTGKSAIGSTSCEASVLKGGNYQYFYYQKAGLVADEIKIKSTMENGETETKTEDFNSEKGVSEDSFNLWVESLFQDPLLDSGKNILELSFYNEDRLVHTDTVTLVVSQGPTYRCPRTSEHSNNINNCRMPRSYCYSYFRRNNSCQ